MPRFDNPFIIIVQKTESSHGTSNTSFQYDFVETTKKAAGSAIDKVKENTAK
jgi:hypothetical protein